MNKVITGNKAMHTIPHPKNVWIDWSSVFERVGNDGRRVCGLRIKKLK